MASDLLTVDRHVDEPSRDRRPTRPARRGRRRVAVVLATTLIAAAVLVVTSGGSPGRTGAGAAPDVVAPPVLAPAGAQAVPAGLAQALAEVPSPGAAAARLAAHGVTLTVDGAPVAETFLGSTLAGLEQHAVQTAVLAAGATSGELAPTDVSASRQIARQIVSGDRRNLLAAAVASVTLRTLLWQTALASGTEVTAASARAFAGQELAEFDAQQAAGTPTPLPAGESTSEAFTSPDAVRAYQQLLTVDEQMTGVAGPPVVDGVPADRTPALAAWLSEQLATADVVLRGARGIALSTLPADLPGGM